MTGTGPDQGDGRGSPGPGTGSARPAGGPRPGPSGSGPPANPGPAGGPGGQADTEPDARFTFANERTFLAWSRTGLALIVAGLGIVQLLPPFPGVPWGRHLIGVPLIVLGAIVAVAGYAEWVRNQRALRRGKPVPRSFLPVVLTVTITAIAVASAVVLLVSAVR
jgi:putative membrane protein